MIHTGASEQSYIVMSLVNRAAGAAGANFRRLRCFLLRETVIGNSNAGGPEPGRRLRGLG
jgi:cytochrome c oxidase assembly protein Cox11